jgi:hypothetical protein
VTALGHSRGSGCAQTDRTCRRLRLGRDEDLQYVVPVDVDVGVDALRAIVGPGVNDETIVGVNVSAQLAYAHNTQKWRGRRKHTLPYPQHDIQNLAPKLGCVEGDLRHI